MQVRWLGMLLSALFVVAGPVAAQTPATDAPASPAATTQAPPPIDHWSTDAVVSALRTLNASDLRATTAAVTARTRDGLNVGVYAKACDPAPPGVDATCHGLEAIISFDPGAKADRKALVDQLNHQFALGKFLEEPDGSIRLSRYVVFDGAVTPANLRAELATLFQIGVLTTKTLWPDTAKS